MFCHGVCVDAGAGFEAQKVRHSMDGGKSSFPLQVNPSTGTPLKSQSFAALQGPLPYMKHLISPPRIPFTAAYFGSLGLTLYFAVGVMTISGSADD